MSRSATDHGFVLWMEREGEIYSPSMPLCRNAQDAIESDIWQCVHAGVCHSIYRYGSERNGGSYCREITEEVAARLGRMSFSARREPASPVRRFLEAFGVEFYTQVDDRLALDRRAYPHFEMEAPRADLPARKNSRRKGRSKPLTAEELRAQPQFKLPIPGGRSPEASTSTNAIESDEESGVEQVSLRDERPLVDQSAAWQRFDEKLRAMGIKRPSEPPSGAHPEALEKERTRKAAGSRS